MQLTHWIDKEYLASALSGDLVLSTEMPFKPKGIWLSVDGDWEEWLKYNWPEWLKGKVQLEAQIKVGVNLLTIYNQTDFEEEWYKAIGKRLTKDFFLVIENTKTFHQYLYDNYDGIRVVWSGVSLSRLDNMYFYGWDCSCIAIFNTNNVILKEHRVAKRNY